jgi:fimbrial chaperone protein
MMLLLKPGLTRALAAGALLSCAMPALAGIFSVTPVRIFMTPRDRAVAITLVNEGDTEVALQADINSWKQKADGTDELVLTEDLILSPPIIKLAPKARQVVRLALLRAADPAQQLTYRLIVREVPEATAPRELTVAVPIALALSMPVFITPPPAKRNIVCEIERAAESVQTSCSNSGTAYAQVRQVTLARGGATLAQFEGGNYLLPGARKTLPLSAAQAVAAGDAVLNVMFDDGISQAFNVKVP